MWCKSSNSRAEVLNYSGETWAGGAYDGIRQSYTGFQLEKMYHGKTQMNQTEKKKIMSY